MNFVMTPLVRSCAVIAPIAALAFALAGCGRPSNAQAPGGPGGPGGPPPALPVTAIEVQPKSVPTFVEAVGQTEGAKEVQVRARVTGILEAQAFEEGSLVKAGSVMYRIERAPYEIALAQARANLAQQRSLADQAQREAERLKQLFDDKAISDREYQQQAANARTQAAAMQSAQAAVRTAELNLSYTAVLAPISGVTGRNLQSQGSLVTAGNDSALLTTLTQTDPLWVRFSFSQDEYLRLRRSDTKGADLRVRLKLSDGSMYDQVGKINFASSTVDRAVGTVQLRAAFANPKLALLPGQYVRARVLTGENTAFVVPQVAVLQSDQGSSVWVVGADGKAQSRPVQAGAWQGSEWVVTQGLQAGDRVITDNLIKLRPGAAVQPHAPGQAPQAPPHAGSAASGAAAPTK